MTKIRVNESGKEYSGKNISLDSDSDIPIIVINCLTSKDINKTVKRFLKMSSLE